MDTVPYQQVLREAAGLAGFTLDQLSATPKTQLKTFISRRAREYWRRGWWAQLMHAEERFYRSDYAAGTTYATGDQVYYATTAKYYEALQATTGNLPTNATYWEEVTELDAYVALAQAGENEIGDVRLVSPDNPAEIHDPRTQPFRLIGDRIYILGEDVPSSVYVWYREPAPRWIGDDFDATAAYGVGEIVYYESDPADYDPDFEGDFFECVATTTAGQSPETVAASWSRIEFPAFLAESVAQAAYADFVRQDGNPAVARLEQSEAERLLLLALHRDGPAQRQISRATGA